MNVTERMRAYASEKCGLAAGASDEEIRSAVLGKLASGDLNKKEFDGLCEVDTETSEQKLDRILTEKIGKAIDSVLGPKAHQMAPQVAAGNDGAAAMGEYDLTQNLPDNNPDPAEVFKSVAAYSSQSGSGSNPNVLKASHCYRTTKSALVYSSDKWGRDGKPVRYFEGKRERGMDDLSEMEWAKTTAWMLWQMKKAGLRGLPDWNNGYMAHCKELVKEIAHEETFVGPFDEHDMYGGHYKLNDLRLKTVLDESGASGGGNAVPEFFDMALIRTPLLHGELFPYVEIVNVARGGAADSASIGTPTTVTTGSGSTVSEFSTTSFVSAFDTTFFPMTTAITFGLDFLSDAVPNFAQLVADQIGQEFMRKLDENIAIGDGTTEIQGIFVGSNTTVSGITNTFTSMTFDDILEILFTIDKAHRNAFAGTNTRLVMNDSQYKEYMQINVNSEANHPAFGVNAAKEYVIAGYPVSIQNDISNGNVGLCNLRGYRLYRRQGVQFQTETAGKTLMLDNEQLLLARARFGGSLTLSGYMAELTT